MSAGLHPIAGSNQTVGSPGGCGFMDAMWHRRDELGWEKEEKRARSWQKKKIGQHC